LLLIFFFFNDRFRGSFFFLALLLWLMTAALGLDYLLLGVALMSLLFS
jgi:hypothetical protein